MSFWESRTGVPQAVRRLLDENVPGGARWTYAFGSLLLFLLAAQLCSGFALLLNYAPSTATAWESVARIQQDGLLRVVRALHVHGSTFLLLAAALHLCQTALFGAYRAPREVTWWLGLALLVCLFAFALTGTLLPWDERGYWATRVTLGLVGGAPARVLAGGSEVGNLTLTRFSALHCTLLPLLLGALAAAHVAAVRRHGVTAAPGARRDVGARFWPAQALIDGAFALVALLALLVLSISSPAPLLGPADASIASAARPDWPFRPLFQLLHWLPSTLEFLATLLPLVAVALLAALPWLDRAGASTWRARRPVAVALGGTVVVLVLLGLVSVHADAVNPEFQRAQAQAAERAETALRLAANGVPAGGMNALLQDQPDRRGARLFARHCATCHASDAPDLHGLFSRAWLRDVVLHPDAPAHFGKTKVRGMEPQDQLTPAQLTSVVDALFALRDGQPARPVLHEQKCTECHAVEAGAPSAGPPLAGYGSRRWLRDLLQDPAAYYDRDNGMPAFGRDKTLSPQELDDVVAYLVTLGDEAATVTRR